MACMLSGPCPPKITWGSSLLEAGFPAGSRDDERASEVLVSNRASLFSSPSVLCLMILEYVLAAANGMKNLL